jgi:hypothetical protein
VNDVYNCALVGNNVWGTSMRRIQHEPSVESGSVFCAWRGDSGVLLLHARVGPLEVVEDVEDDNDK